MSDGPESPLKKIPASAHGPLTLPTGEGGISLYKAYTCAAGITPFFTAVNLLESILACDVVFCISSSM